MKLGGEKGRKLYRGKFSSLTNIAIVVFNTTFLSFLRNRGWNEIEHETFFLLFVFLKKFFYIFLSTQKKKKKNCEKKEKFLKVFLKKKFKYSAIKFLFSVKGTKSSYYCETFLLHSLSLIDCMGKRVQKGFKNWIIYCCQVSWTIVKHCSTFLWVFFQFSFIRNRW